LFAHLKNKKVERASNTTEDLLEEFIGDKIRENLLAQNDAKN
jgi:hypothetical protein